MHRQFKFNEFKLGYHKFGWTTRLLSVVAQVATAILKLVCIPAQ